MRRIQSNAGQTIRGFLTTHGLGRLARFGFAGILATALYLVLVYAIVTGLGTDPISASVFAYLLSLIFSYLMQSRFTFRVREDTFGQGLRFVITSLVGLAISYMAMSFCVDVLKLPYTVGAAGVCILIPLTNYIVFQRWVFAHALPAGEGTTGSKGAGTKP